MRSRSGSMVWPLFKRRPADVAFAALSRRRMVCFSTTRPVAVGEAKRGKAIFVAATKEHTGKTSVSMALVSGLIKRFGAHRVAYMKPVGQKYVLVDDGELRGLRVDKDVKAVKEHFGLHCRYRDMSPLVLHKTYTREYLDGKIPRDGQRQRLLECFESLVSTHDFVVVEGTGHTGVGSIVGWSNAKVASTLGLDVILIANGGVGNTFDQLTLNRQLCLAQGFHVGGIILNKVSPAKVEQCTRYMNMALKHWGWRAPLLGVVPMAESLDKPSVLDLENLFHTKVLSGKEHRLRRFERYELVTTSMVHFLDFVNQDKEKYRNTCFITHASRNDIIIGILTHVRDTASLTPGPGTEEGGEDGGGGEGGREGGALPSSDSSSNAVGGLMLTGSPPYNVPHAFILEYIRHSGLPVLCSNQSTTEALNALDKFTAKMHAEDDERISSVIRTYEPYIDFDRVIELGRTPAAAV